MKKIILLILTVALIALPVLSCAADDDGGNQPGPADEGREAPGDTPDGGQDAGPGAETEELRFPDLPDVNFGGYEFRILNTGEDHVRWVLKTLVAEEETGEALNDAIFRRNRRMEDRFGFNLVQIDHNGPGQVRDAARRSINAASDDFDLAMTTPIYALPMAQEGQLVMIDTIPHIDLTKPWWDQDMNRDFSIGHRLFFTSGDFSFNQYSVTVGLVFNRQLHDDLALDCPYALVREGRWTMERFAEQGRAALRDLNGDGVFDHNDQWGYLGQSHVYTLSFLVGMGARYIVKDADDMPVLNINTEGFISRFLKAFDLLTEGWVFDQNRPGPGDPEVMFTNNQGLFWQPFLNSATALRAMDTDFGILPFPKMDEQQERHIASTGLPHVMIIPVTTADLERTGVILEALSAESRLTTLTVYFDTMLVNQIMNRDDDSAEMLDIKFSNRVYETGRFFWDSHVATPIHQAMRDFNRDIASIIERHETPANAAIEAAINAFLQN